jgi:hypothetical protein
MAAIFEDMVERQRAQEDKGIGDLKSLFEDLKIRLEETFKITSEQQVSCSPDYWMFLISNVSIMQTNICSVAQDLMYSKKRVAFAYLRDDLEVNVLYLSHRFVSTNSDQWQNAVRNEKGVLKLTNIFGVPARERELKKHLRKVSSSVLNAFREDVSFWAGSATKIDLIVEQILKSISPVTSICLAQFMYQAAMKYKRGGAGPDIEKEQGLTLRNVMLVRRVTIPC